MIKLSFRKTYILLTRICSTMTPLSTSEDFGRLRYLFGQHLPTSEGCDISGELAYGRDIVGVLLHEILLSAASTSNNARPTQVRRLWVFLDRRWSAEVASDLARAASGLAVAAGGLRGPQVACGGRR